MLRGEIEMLTLQDEFHRAMVGVYEIAKDHGYHATYFLQMLGEHGGVGAAKRLLATTEIQSGLIELAARGLIAHSMEVLVIEERFQSLFTEAEIREAHRRLEELGYFRQPAS